MSVSAIKAFGQLVQDKLRHGDDERSANLTLGSRTRELEGENSNLREKLVATRTHEEVQEETIQQLVVQNAATHTALANTSSELKRVEQELAAQKHQVSEAESKVKKIRSCFLRNKLTVSESTRELSTTKTELSQTKSKLLNTQAELETTQTKLKSAEDTVTSHVNTIRTLKPHLAFRKTLRLRCLLTYRRNKLDRPLSKVEEEKVKEANQLVHGADCLFDMAKLISDPSSPYCKDYERLYGIHPKQIFENQHKQLLIRVTNVIGEVALTDFIFAPDDAVTCFRKRGQIMQKAIIESESGRVSESEIKALEEGHARILERADRNKKWARVRDD